MKKKFSAKLLSILLTMAMVLPLMPLPSFALAAEPQVENSAGAAAEESGAASGDGAEAPQSGSATLDAANATPGASGLQPMAAIDQVKVTQRDFELWNVHVEDYQRPNFYLNYIYTPGMIFSPGLLEPLGEYLGNRTGLLNNALISEYEADYWGGDFDLDGIDWKDIEAVTTDTDLAVGRNTAVSIAQNNYSYS